MKPFSKLFLAAFVIISANIVTAQETKDVPFNAVDVAPIFPGCENTQDNKQCFMETMQEHIGKNFWYPKEAQKEGIQGRVSILFTINKEGNIANIKIRGPHKLLDDAALEIIKKLPKMKPGIHNGKPVDVPFAIPIIFKLG